MSDVSEATMVGNLAIFARSDAINIYNLLTNIWTTTSLSQFHYALAATTVGNLALFGGDFAVTVINRS
jgi:hypothetical protein